MDDDKKETKKDAAGAPPLGSDTGSISSGDSVPEPQLAKKPTGSDNNDDSTTAKAVDDIAEKEADEILKAEDEAVKKAFNEDKKQPGFFRRFWGNKVARRILFFVILATIAVLAIVPTTRYAILNTFGVRSSASLTVIDNSTQQPLKNVNVYLGEVSATTNDDGYAARTNQAGQARSGD